MGDVPVSARLGGWAILHPFPSLLVASATGLLAVVAGGTPARAILLSAAMLGFQVSIGAINDLRDREDDVLVQPWKPLAAGRVSARTAIAIAGGGGLVGAMLSWAAGPASLLVGLSGYGLGLAYDLRLKRTAWGWVAFAIALPLVPVYAWVGVGLGLPPSAGALAILGALAGFSLAVANGLVDRAGYHDRGSGSLAVRMGPARARAAIVIADVLLLIAAAVTLVGGTGAPVASLAAFVGATVALGVGAFWSTRATGSWPWLGWQAQAVGVALLGIGWLAAAVSPG